MKRCSPWLKTASTGLRSSCPESDVAGASSRRGRKELVAYCTIIATVNPSYPLLPTV